MSHRRHKYPGRARALAKLEEREWERRKRRWDIINDRTGMRTAEIQTFQVEIPVTYGDELDAKMWGGSIRDYLCHRAARKFGELLRDYPSLIEVTESDTGHVLMFRIRVVAP